MKYKLKKVSKWNLDYSQFHPDLKGQNNTMITQETTDVFTTTSEIVLKAIIRNELDVPDYEPNEKNIIKEFGSHVSKKSISQIINFYKYRKVCYSEFLNWFEEEHLNNDAYFHFEIPYEFNHFEILHDVNIEKEKQLSYYFEITIEKD